MARNFNGTTQYLNNASGVLTATPLTMACWFKVVDITTRHTLMSLGVEGTGTNRFVLSAAGNVANDPVRASTTAAASSQADTSTGYSANVWQHACGVWASATDRKAYLNGGGEGANSTSRVPVGINSTYIGAVHFTAPTEFTTGSIAEAAIWNVTLNTSEIAALAKGVSPLRIRPNALVAYWPLFGVGSPEPDYSNGGFHLTLNAAPTQADHAPVMPAFYRADWFGAVAGTVAHAVSVSETITLTESATVQTSAPQVLASETVTLSETAAAQLVSLVSASETVTLSEDTTSTLVSFVAASETLTLAESASAFVTISLSVAETITLSESVTGQLDAFISAAETVTLSETVSQQLGITVAASETLTLTETATVAPLLLAGVSVGETVTLTDLATIAVIAAAAVAIMPDNAAYAGFRDKRAMAKGR